MNENDRNESVEELLREIRERREKAAKELQLDSYIKDAPEDAQPEQAEAPAQPTAAPAPQEAASDEAFDFEAEFEEIKKHGAAAAKKKSGESADDRDTARTAAAKDKRSVLGSLRTEDKRALTEEYDPINKNMLAPTIERGVDVVPAPAEGLLEQEMDDAQDGEKHTENHRLFTEEIPKQAFFEDVPAQPTGRAPQSAGVGRVILDAAASKAQKKGILNVKDNIDDNFREFFSNTVVIDRQPIEDKTKKQRRIKDFIFSDAESGVSGGPVFEEDDEQNKKKTPVQDESDLLEAYLGDAGRLGLRTAVTGVLAGILLLLNLLAQFGALPGPLSGGIAYYALNAALFIGVIVCNARDIFGGLGDLVAFRADAASMTGFGALLCAAELAALLAGGAQPRAVSACALAVALFCQAFGYWLNAHRVADTYADVIDSDERYASNVLGEQTFTRKITRGLDLSKPQVLLKRRTGHTDNFEEHAAEFDMTTQSVSTAASVLMIACVVLGAAAFLLGGKIAGALSAAAFTAALSTPFLSTFSSAWPIGNAQAQLTKRGGYLPGYSAADEICEANCVVLTGREIFPKDNVMLHGIKTFEKERVDKAILYAASVIIQSCDTMAHMFLNVIQNKTEMLYPVDDVEYESDLGFSFWVDKERILLGTRDLLTAHDIDVPSRDYENRYTKTSTRDAIYLAVGGKLYAMFVMSYSPNEEVSQALHLLEDEGINIVVHTRDFNLNAAKISKMYGIPKSMISVVREDDVPELTKKTSYTAHTPSSYTHIGSLTSFISGISASRRLPGAVGFAMNVELASMIAGGVLAALTVVFGSSWGVSPLYALLFQGLWLAVCAAGVFTRKI
ncbi:MAG: hypothetical protein VB021_07915 [Oscillospiraceae bacterium]|nr:hypothetical protein [Oscillospiraceae bacterium]